MDDALAPEKREVLRHGRLRKVEVGPDSANAFLRIDETLENADTDRVAEGLENVGPLRVTVTFHGIVYVSGRLTKLSMKI